MGTITKIEQQKNKDRVNIFVDEAFFSGMGKETAVMFGLKVGREIDEETLRRACRESEVKRAFEKACEYLGARMHSKKELMDKLFKKGFEREVIEGAIAKLEEYKYIDDEIFARNFVQANSKYSKKVLEMKLFMRGVSKIVIGEVLSERTNDDEFELCLCQAEKYARGRDISTREGAQKLFAALARKGFKFETIKATVSRLTKSDMDFDE